ncbi:MAG: hypothetical protein IJU19_06620 [Bacteroidales bacterium]|nr:hypothetical protein [Bacteroidales bacterium]
MIKSLDITPKLRIGDLQFHMARVYVESLLGKSDEAEVIEGTDGEEVTLLQYSTPSLSLFFSPDGTLSCIDISDANCTIWNTQIFGMTIQQIQALIRTHGYTDFEINDEAWGERSLSVPSAGLDFYFEDDTLVSISMNP